MQVEQRQDAAVKLALATGRLIVATDGIGALQEQRIEALEAMEAFASLPPSAPVDRDAVEGNIRTAIWNACMKGGMGQDLSLALIERAMSEAMMIRALTPSKAESTSNDCLLVAEGWQDIATAPKDGSLIDVWTQWGERATNVKWDRERGYWVDWSMDSFDNMAWCRFGDPISHWMKAPAPPAVTDLSGVGVG